MSDKPIIHTPHDLFFKNAVDDVSVAKAFFQAHLPPSIQQRIQWDTLQLTNKSFAQEQLKEFHSDVVYACQLDRKPAYLYLLIEQHLKQQEKKHRKVPLPRGSRVLGRQGLLLSGQ